MSLQRWTGVALLGGLLGVLLIQSLGATMKMKKDTGKKCLFCHTVVPEKGDKDPRLNRDGKIFKENGYKLTEEQKRKPGGSGSDSRFQIPDSRVSPFGI